MAQKIQTLFIDDIDGGEADGTVRFSLDGTEYEIELNARHTDELRTTLKSYIEHGRKVGEVMTRDVETIGEDSDVSEAVDRMIRRHIKRLPVLRGQTVVGVIARSDLLKGLLAATPQATGPHSDAEIKAAIQAELDKLDWAPRSVHRKARAAAAAVRDIERETGRDAKDAEVAARMGSCPLSTSAHARANDAARASVAGLTDTERSTLAQTAVSNDVQTYSYLKPQLLSVNYVDQNQVLTVTLTYNASSSPFWALNGLVPMPSPTLVRSASVQIGGY